MNLRKQLLTNNPCYLAAGELIPRGVMVHSTGANNPSLSRYVQPDDGLLGNNAYNNDWNQRSVNVCVHAFIGKLKDGKIATYQTLPFETRAWHAGKGNNGSANDSHIGFEICEGNLDDADYFKEVYQEAVEFTAYLCKLYKLNPLQSGVVICHSEGNTRGIASAHADVMHWFPRHGKSMDSFRADVARKLKGEKDMTKQETELIAKDVYQNLQVVYKTLADIPAWGKPTVAKLVRKNLLTGSGDSTAIVLNLPYETLRLLVINDRAGLYGG